MKNTLRILSVSVILGTFTLSAVGQRHQGGEGRMEQFKSMKISYITENLKLTVNEAEKFWPVYNAHENTKHDLYEKRKIRSKELTQLRAEISDGEAEKIIDQNIQLRKEELQLDVEFQNELKKIIGAKKTMLLYITEMEFRELMMQKIRDEQDSSTKKQGKDLP